MNEVKRAEDMEREQLAEYAADMMHRMMVHHTLWFREVEHQLGFGRALAVMDEAWAKTRRVVVGRLSEELGFPQSDGMPAALAELPRERLLRLLEATAKNWLAQDGIWFQAVEAAYGMNDAKRCNDSTWSRFSPFEAHAIKRLLGMGERPGLEGLARALNFRMYAHINRQSCRWEGGDLIFEMNDCRVQSARLRKGLADYPCKSAGLVEYARFAEAVDDRIVTSCVGCPPDPHPGDWFCAWRFSLRA
ncbi:MAG: hypothetical protein IJU05_02180 [Schwartzia sp.]|nr:hypothetical protein [Schwartzia sp. (in: firmicutes)]